MRYSLFSSAAFLLNSRMRPRSVAKSKDGCSSSGLQGLLGKATPSRSWPFSYTEKGNGGLCIPDFGSSLE